VKGIITIILLLSFPGWLGPPSKPNLSGTWVFDEPSSRVSAGLSNELKGTIYVIVHSEPKVRIITSADLGGVQMSHEYVYYSDGRGETNTINGREIESVTKWSGNKLIIKYTTPFSIGNRQGKVKVTETWQLDNEGRKLTRTISRIVRVDLPPSENYPRGDPELQEIKIVFARSP
jgi:hypothetical protein